MPWENNNGNGGGGDDKSPWSRPTNQGQGGGGSSDLEEQMKRMQERFRSRKRGGGARGNGGGGGGDAKGMGKLGFGLFGLVAMGMWLMTSVAVVDAGEQAVVFRFGEWTHNFDAGFHLHLPAPFETHEIVNTERERNLSIGQNAGEPLMLTQDENIVDIHFDVFWKVRDDAPEDFILNVKNPEEAVRDVSESVMREVVGKSPLTLLITSERDEVQRQAKAQIQALLDTYRAGIVVQRVQIQKSDPPRDVIEAFNDVNRAEQDAITVVNEATRYANEIVPEARGQAQSILQNAEAYRDQVVANSRGEAQRFTQILTEYRLAPEVTKQRMYLETLERVLARTDNLFLDQESGAVPYLPLAPTGR